MYGPNEVPKSLKDLPQGFDKDKHKKKALQALQSEASKGPTTFMLKIPL
jgi:hypothetical protein